MDNKKEKKSPVHPDALEALKNMDRGESPLKSGDEGSGSATGFVAMLAHDNNQPDIFSPLSSVLEADTKASQGNAPPPRPQPKSLPGTLRTAEAEIPEATIIAPVEVETSAPIAMTGPGKPASPISFKAKSQHDWYRVVVPLMLVMGSMLLVVGLWAVASLAGMPNSLIPHDHSSQRYHDAISLAWYMLIALPIGILLDSMAIFMLYRLHGKK